MLGDELGSRRKGTGENYFFTAVLTVWIGERELNGGLSMQFHVLIIAEDSGEEVEDGNPLD